MTVIEPWQVYLFVKINDIREFIGGLTPLLVLAFIFSIVGYVAFRAANNDFDLYKPKWPFNWKIKMAFATLFLAALTTGFLSRALPSMKELAAIILIPKIVNNEKVQGFAGDATTLMVSSMKKWAEEAEVALKEVDMKKEATKAKEEVKKAAKEAVKEAAK